MQCTTSPIFKLHEILTQPTSTSVPSFLSSMSSPYFIPAVPLTAYLVCSSLASLPLEHCPSNPFLPEQHPTLWCFFRSFYLVSPFLSHFSVFLSFPSYILHKRFLQVPLSHSIGYSLPFLEHLCLYVSCILASVRNSWCSRL